MACAVLLGLVISRALIFVLFDNSNKKEQFGDFFDKINKLTPLKLGTTQNDLQWKNLTHILNYAILVNLASDRELKVGEALILLL